MQTTSTSPNQFSPKFAYALLFKYGCDWNDFHMSYHRDYRVIAPDFTLKVLKFKQGLRLLTNLVQILHMHYYL